MDADRNGAPPRRAPKSASPELHVPPNNPEAERSLLACILWDAGSVLESCREHNLTSRAFYHGHHRQLFDRAWEMHAAGMPVDAVTLAAELSSRGELEKFGGMQMLSDIAGAYQSAAGAPMFIASLLELEERRSTLRDLSVAVEAIRNPTVPPAEAKAQLLERLSKSGPRHSRLPPMVSARELVANPPKAPPVLIDGILHQGEKLMFGAASKAGKTWWALDLALSVASGFPFFGHRTTQSKVLYVNLEISAYWFQKRLAAVANAKGVEIPEGLTTWNLRGTGATAEEIVEDIIRRRHEWRLVILDPLYKVLGDRSENSAEDMASLLGVLERLTTEADAALVFPAHFAKGDSSTKDQLDRVAGSGVFARDADGILTMTRHQEADCYTIEGTLRNMRSPEPFVVRWDYPLFRRDESLDPSQLRQHSKPGPKSKSSVEEIAALIPSGGATYSEWLKLAEVKLEISQATFNRRKREALLAEAVEKFGFKYFPQGASKCR